MEASKKKHSVLGIAFSNERQKVLILKRRDVPMWVLPGGGVDQGETPDEAVLREIFEETGFKTKVKKKAAEYSPINNLTRTTHVYECEIVEGEMTTGAETKEVKFCSFEELPENFFVLHRVWLQDALLNQAETIRRPITEVTYWKLFCYFLQHPAQVLRLLLSRIGMPFNDKGP